jgi:hypothetical protein
VFLHSLEPELSCRQAGFADAVEETLRGRSIGDQQQPGSMAGAQVRGKAANFMNGIAEPARLRANEKTL